MDNEFENLYVTYHDRLVMVARRFVRDGMAVQDIVADSFVAFWNRRDSLAAGTNHPVYLMSIVKNNCLNYLETQQIHSRIEQQIHTRQSRMVEANIRSLQALDPDILFSSEVEQIVAKTLWEMPELTRTVFELSRNERKTYKGIARELDISERKVTSEIQRALALFRTALKDYMPLWLRTTGFARDDHVVWAGFGPVPCPNGKDARSEPGMTREEPPGMTGEEPMGMTGGYPFCVKHKNIYLYSETTQVINNRLTFPTTCAMFAAGPPKVF